MHPLGQRLHIYKKIWNIFKGMGSTKCPMYSVCVCDIYTWWVAARTHHWRKSTGTQEVMTGWPHTDLSGWHGSVRLEGGRTGLGNTFRYLKTDWGHLEHIDFLMNWVCPQRQQKKNWRQSWRRSSDHGMKQIVVVDYKSAIKPHTHKSYQQT